MNMGSDLFAGWETQQVALARPPSPHMYSSLDTPLSDSCCINPAINMSRPVGSPSPVPAYNFDQPTFYPSPDKSSSPDTSSTSPSCCSQSHDHHLPGLDTPSPASSPDCTSITKLTDPLTNPRPVPSYPQLELISRLLSSFPTLLKKPTTAPPFIHRSRLLPGHRAEALANVTALVHMSSVKSPESKSFVAAMITSEFERIEKTVLTLTSGNGPSGWAAIENYQALVVLALLRYFSGDLLVRDLTAMETLSVRIGFEGMFTNGELPPNESWEDWLIAESKRRTFVIVFLLGRLFHYRAGLLPLSCDGTGAVQLPACRSMWEAMSAKDWTEETEAVFAWPGWDTGRRKWMTFQDLEKGEAKMAVWYAGMDALGMVIMADALVKKDVGETISATCHGGKVRGCLEGLEGMEGMEGMEGL